MEVSSLPRGGGRGLSHPRQVLKAFSDERLVEQIRRGNEAAFEVVYERHHRGILSFCRHMLSSPDEAEDAVQQVFVSAYYDLAASDKPIRLKAWLYTIARNRCLSIIRARREQPTELDDIPTTGLSESVQQREDLRRMLADLHDLPIEQRAALVLSELGDLSHTDIAGVLDVPTPKVKSLVFQARSSLIESREARETSCQEIREQLATLRGGALRRGPLRKHLKACAGCRDFRAEVKRQRAAAALILPVVPSAGLKGTIMGAIGGGGAAGGGVLGLGAGGTALATGGATLGSSAGVGGIVAAIGASGATKVATAAVIATGVVAGGTVVVSEIDGGSAQGAPMVDHTARDVPRSDAVAIVETGPRGGPAIAKDDGRKAKDRDKGKEAPVAGFFIDTGVGSGPGGAGSSDGKGSGKDGSKGDGWFVDGPGRSASRGNGENGTRAHGNGNGKGKKGGGPGHIPPRSESSPNAGQPAPPTSPGKGNKGTRGNNGNGRGPKVPLPQLLP